MLVASVVGLHRVVSPPLWRYAGVSHPNLALIANGKGPQLRLLFSRFVVGTLALVFPVVFPALVITRVVIGLLTGRPLG
jgi:hypothetical protein